MGQPEAAASGEAGERGLLLGLGQALELDLENGFGLVGGRDDLVGTRKPPAMRGNEPRLGREEMDRGWLLPVHVELHETYHSETPSPQRQFPHSAVRIRRLA
jgi:hypothetical protein